MTTNPLFNANRLKLGIFGTNGKGGAQTLVPEAYRPTWAASVETAQMADAAGFEAIVAYARWKGYIPGRPEHASGIVLDPFTWSAGIAQATALPLKAAVLAELTGFSMILFPFQAVPVIVGLTMAGVTSGKALRLMLPFAAVSLIIAVPVNMLWLWGIGLLP